MTFKDLQSGSQVYILIKGDKVAYHESSIVSVSAPRAEMPQLTGTALPQYRQVVDVTYTVNGKTYTDAVEVNSTMFSTNSTGSPTLVSTDKEAILREVRETLKQSEKFLKDVDKHKKRIKECQALISELDTEYNEKIQTENRLKKLEESSEQTNEMLKKILDKITENKLFT